MRRVREPASGFGRPGQNRYWQAAGICPTGRRRGQEIGNAAAYIAGLRAIDPDAPIGDRDAFPGIGKVESDRTAGIDNPRGRPEILR